MRIIVFVTEIPEYHQGMEQGSADYDPGEWLPFDSLGGCIIRLSNRENPRALMNGNDSWCFLEFHSKTALETRHDSFKFAVHVPVSRPANRAV